MNAALETMGLGKRYGKTWALQECTLSLPANRVIGLVGPNGAGKTTLLELAVGLLHPSAGEVRVLGLSPRTQLDLLLPRVGFVAQSRPLYRTLTVQEMLAFGQGYNPRFDAELARDRLESLDLPLDRPTGKLSGGQQAQMALVMALAKCPDLLILDEPIASLDPLARQEFQQILVEAVADSGQTVIFSSHLVSDLEHTCDYLIILSDSRVQLAGEIEQVLQTHKRLIGPHERAAAIARTHQVLQCREAERHTTLLVRTESPVLDPAWIVGELSLEDIILAYLANARSGKEAPGHELKRL